MRRYRLAFWMLVIAQICVFAHTVLPHHHHDGVVTVCLHHHEAPGHSESDDEHCCSLSDVQYLAEEEHHIDYTVDAENVSWNKAVVIQLYQTACFRLQTFQYTNPIPDSYVLRGPPFC